MSMVSGDVLYAPPKNLHGIKRLEVMSDIIPLEIPAKAQFRVLILQLIVNVSVHLPKAL